MGRGLRMPCVLALSRTARRPSGVFGPRFLRLGTAVETKSTSSYLGLVVVPILVPLDRPVALGLFLVVLAAPGGPVVFVSAGLLAPLRLRPRLLGRSLSFL